MTEFALGLMSGTSMDGIDVAVIDVHQHQLIVAKTFPYSAPIYEKVKKVMNGECFDASFFAQLDREIGLEFANAANQMIQQMTPQQKNALRVIGSHGQTVCHQPKGYLPFTWQMGCPHTISQLCARPVVFHFRNANIAAGGQGAPLAPIYHQQLFGKTQEAAVVNIGGISNISFISPQRMEGYDVGPGNCLMDAWIEKNLQLHFDSQGAWSASGTISYELLEQMSQDAFLTTQYPKSIGKEYYSMGWLENYLQGFHLSPQDVQATLCAYTVMVIAEQIKTQLPVNREVWICGGGAKNLEILKGIKIQLNQYHVRTTSEAGVSEDYLEAMMMAWLGWMRYTQQSINLHSIMGGNIGHQLVGLICE